MIHFDDDDMALLKSAGDNIRLVLKTHAEQELNKTIRSLLGAAQSIFAAMHDERLARMRSAKIEKVTPGVKVTVGQG